MIDKNSKLFALDFGRFAEEIASREYIKDGYAILERNWRLGKTEIDIIAQKEDIVAIVEVKARSGEDEDPLETVTRDKRKRMVRAADFYLNCLPGNIKYRFDIFAMTGNKENYSIEKIEDAFVASDIL